MIALITYNLKKADKDYKSFFEEIRKNVWWHYLESTWIVNTNETVKDLSTRLRAHMDSSDSLFVVNISHTQKYGWLPTGAWEWFNKNDIT